MNVVIFHNLITQQGRRAVEVRVAAILGNIFISNETSTVYSCEYDCALGEKVAIQRAAEFCVEEQHNVLHFETRSDCKAAWQ